jgi:hypothetical protein
MRIDAPSSLSLAAIESRPDDRRITARFKAESRQLQARLDAELAAITEVYEKQAKKLAEVAEAVVTRLSDHGTIARVTALYNKAAQDLAAQYEDRCERNRAQFNDGFEQIRTQYLNAAAGADVAIQAPPWQPIAEPVNEEEQAELIATLLRQIEERNSREPVEAASVEADLPQYEISDNPLKPYKRRVR